MDVWHEIERERLDLAGLIASLDSAQLATGSLCEGWTVKHVAAHVLSIAIVPRRTLTLRVARNFFRFDDTFDRIACEFVRQPDEQLVAAIRDPPLGGYPLSRCFVAVANPAINGTRRHRASSQPALAVRRFAAAEHTARQPVGRVGRVVVDVGSPLRGSTEQWAPTG